MRLPLDILEASIGEIGDFPFEPKDGIRFDKPALFVKGGNSKYINRKNIGAAEEMFPQMRLETIEGAGHWGEHQPSPLQPFVANRREYIVHSEKPKEFVDLVDKFCK